MRRLCASILIGALPAVLAAVPGQAGAAGVSVQPPAAPLVAPDERAARDAARSSGQPVEALSDRTEYAQVFADPDGRFTYRVSPAPQRVRRADGTWAAVDTTLRPQAGGSIAPAASPAGLVISGGGSGPLFTVSRAGERLSFTWPGGPLPSPVLSGSAATYASVLPGVDLRLTATSTGVSEVLVVHDAAAAASPALARITFGLSTSGLTVAEQPGGGLTATDATGADVFDSPAPSMWDAAGADAGPDQAGIGSHRAALGAQLGAAGLTLTPAPALLAGAGTVFPLYIDPEVTVHGPQAGWLDVARDTNGATWGDWEPSDARLGAFCSPDSSGTCLNSYRGEYRSYFDFVVPHEIWDAGQISATLFTNETWSWTCSVKTTAELWQTGFAKQGITWSDRPSEDQWQDGQTVAYGNTCPAHGVAFTASGAAASAAKNHWSDLTLELRAYIKDEDNWNVDSWKRFSVAKTSDPYLQITYDHAPDAPTSTTTLDGSRSLGCAASGTWISTTSPSLQAKITDPDGGNVKGNFHYARSSGSPSGTLSTAYLGSGSTFTVQTSGLADGTYSWYAWGYDGTLNGPNSPSCSFSVDTSAPATPAISSDIYVSGQATNPVGQVGTFTFSDPGNVDPADGVNDVAGYRYGFTAPPVNYVAAASLGGSASVPISPVWLGGRTLYVQAVDRAGNLSASAQFDVETVRPAGNPTPLLAWWKLDEGSGTTAADATGNGHTATLGAQAGWGAGRASGTSALSLTGAGDSEAFTAPQLPPVDNTGSFTVSAWVKLSPACASSPSTCGFYDPVSMDGVTQSAFALEYVDQTWCAPGAGDGVNGCWGFTMPASDITNPPASTVEAATPVSFGTWTHLTGVFDQVHQTIDIYVNGQLASAYGSVTGVQPWAGPAMGPLRIGRTLYNGGAFNWWPGEVSEVCAFWGTLDATQVQNVYSGGCGSAGAP